MIPVETIGPGANPGGLVAHLIVEGDVVDVSPLTLETAETAGVRHAGAFVELSARRSRARGVKPQAIEVRVFDGDSGELVAKVSTP